MMALGFMSETVSGSVIELSFAHLQNEAKPMLLTSPQIFIFSTELEELQKQDKLVMQIVKTQNSQFV